MHIMRAIGQTERAYALFRSASLSKVGLSGYQGLYLRTVCIHPGITQEDVATRLVFNKSSVARQLSALEKAGLVKRQRCEKDKRSVRVYPTEKGEALLPLIRECSKEFFKEVSRDLTEEEISLLERLCEKVCIRAKEALQKK